MRDDPASRSAVTAEESFRRQIAGLPATVREVGVATRRIRLCTVLGLEDLVDRAALLRGDVEPPYWAHLWSGALVLADYLVRFAELRGRRVLEIGCGLGLPGVTAAALGATVTFVDAEPAALAFVAESAAANGIACTTMECDFTRLPDALRIDVLLAAEVAYDRGRFDELAAVFARHLADGGVALLADGHRIDTRALYPALAARGLATHAIDVQAIEEGRPVSIRLTVVRRFRPGDTPRPLA
jgi:predicted nicotinamide N-methyase